MSKGLKKTLIIVGGIIAIIIAIMILIPFLFKDKIKSKVVAMANENLNAKVVINDFGLNLFSNFPNATLSLNDATIVGINEFEADTLLKTKQASVTIDLFSLFGDNYNIKKINLDETSVYAKVLENGKSNWAAIMKEDSTQVATKELEEESAFTLNLDNIDIKKGNIVYEDFESNIKAYINGWNGNIKGDFSASETTLKTRSIIDELTFVMDGIPYLSKGRGVADAQVKANFEQMKFTFIDSHCSLNELAAIIDGSFAFVGEEAYDFDLKLKAPHATFKQVLSIVPAMYNDEFKNIKTAGDVSLSAYLMGEMSEKNFPAIDLRLTVSDAMFQYPSLPKAVEDINLILSINGEGGSLDKIMVLVDKFGFRLGNNPFKGNFRMTPAGNDRSIKLNADGKLDLGIIKEVYPLKAGVEISGNVDADISVATTSSAMENEQYDKMSADGHIKLNNMVYKSPDMPNISVNDGALEFTSRYANLSNLDIKIGESDLKATGRLENYIGYALKNQTIKGRLDLRSRYLNLDELMGDDGTEEVGTTEDSSPFIIPKNIDFALNASISQILFSKINIANFAGAVNVKDGTLSMNNVRASTLEGLINASGAYNTSDGKAPKVNFDLELTRVSFAETFKHIEAVQKFAPIFEDVTGTYSMNFKFGTKMGANINETLAALSGAGVLQTSDLRLEGNKTLAALGSALKTDKLDNIAPKNLNLPFEIKDGALRTEPFAINLGDGGEMLLEGVTKLDQTIDYKGTIKLPSSLANKYVSSVPLTIKGSFSNPKIEVDLKAAVSDVIGSAVDQLLGGKKGENGEEGKPSSVGSAIGKLLGKESGAAGTKEEQIEKIRKDAEENATKLTEGAKKAAEKLETEAGGNALAKIAAKRLGQEGVKKAEAEAQKIKDKAEEKIKALEAEE